MSTTGQTIFIGDIHGCSLEFSKLLDLVSPAVDDHIVLMGDVVNKGPDPLGVFRTIQSINCLSLRGNHDNDHLKWREGVAEPSEESRATRQAMPEMDYQALVNFLSKTPLFHETADYIAVHAAFHPGTIMEKQSAELLMGEVKIDLHWKDHLNVNRPVVVGHKRYSEIGSEPCIIEGKFYGIDTGCVFGGALTALALPSGKVWQVRAEKAYAPEPVSSRTVITP